VTRSGGHRSVSPTPSRRPLTLTEVTLAISPSSFEESFTLAAQLFAAALQPWPGTTFRLVSASSFS